jgi:NO-binding membrane sensor protein with MHYT domain
MVVLSVLVAIVASYATLELAGRVTAARRRARVYWVVGGATSMGTGIWAMHYIGMLAFSLPVKVFYDLSTVLISLLAAIVASAIALYTASRDHPKSLTTAVASLFMGCGIAAMHYIGMAAMRLPARMHYRPSIVVVSIGLAVAISFVALILSIRVREETQASWRKVFSAVVMGSAIPVMHYTGMWGVTFTPTDEAVDLSNAVNISSLGMAGIGTVSMMVLLLAIGTSFWTGWSLRNARWSQRRGSTKTISARWLKRSRKSYGRRARMDTRTSSTNIGTTTPAEHSNTQRGPVGRVCCIPTICP